MFHRWTRHHLKPIKRHKIVKIGSLLAEIRAESIRRNGPPKGGGVEGSENVNRGNGPPKGGSRGLKM